MMVPRTVPPLPSFVDVPSPTTACGGDDDDRLSRGRTTTTTPAPAPGRTTTITASSSSSSSSAPEDRVSRLESGLLLPPRDGGPSSSGGRFDGRLGEVRQFLDILKNMQSAVSNTPDDNQRARKSRALDALLGMFERIVEDRNNNNNNVVVDRTDHHHPSSAEDDAMMMRRLDDENRELSKLCFEKDGQLRDLASELRRARVETGRLADENDRLRTESARARENCARERERAREAGELASAAEGVRDGLLADYARLTEENVELRRAASEFGLMDDGIASELEACRGELDRLRDGRDRTAEELRRRAAEIVELRRAADDARADNDGLVEELGSCREGEMSRLRDACDKSNEELRRKVSELADVEKRMDDLHDQLASERNSLISANEERVRLRDELRISQRNSTSASEQLIRLRDQFSRFRLEDDASRRRDGVEREDDVRARAGRSRPAEAEGGTTTSRSYTDRERDEVDPSSREWARGMARANDVPRARLDESNARADGSIGPRSVKSAVDWTNGDDASPVSLMTASQREGSSEGAARGGISTTKVDGSNSRNALSSRSVGHGGSRVTSAMDEFSLDGLDSIMNDEVGDGIPSRKAWQLGPKEENAHPNLMDYFYSQIKNAE